MFVGENDGVSASLPIRHVRIPANQPVKFYCRYQFVSLMNITGEDIEVTLPAGGAVTGSRTVWEPPFTPTNSVTVSNVADFKAQLNTVGVDEVVLTPGVYDLQASGNQMSNTNYGAAMTKNLRIRSSTGNADDVVFRVANPATAGMQWQVILSVAKTWILKGLSFDLEGCVQTGPARAARFRRFGPHGRLQGGRRCTSTGVPTRR